MSQRDESSGTDEQDPVDDTESAGGEAGAQAAPEADVIEPRFAEDLSDEQRLRAQLDEAAARLRTVSKAYTDLQKEMDAFR